MNITRTALSNPTAVVAAVLLVMLFGIISLTRLPIQMIPNIERPLIQITTTWRAAAPDEVEADIVEPQEDALRGLPGLEKMESSASRGNGSVTLTFAVDVDLQRALIETMNRLNRVPSYPPDADEPNIYAGRSAFGDSIAWFAMRPKPGNPNDVSGYQDFVEEVVEPRIERVSGISNSDAYGGRSKELRITFDPYQVAALDLQLPVIIAAVGNNNDVTGGFTDVGRRQYTVRYAGRYDLNEFADMVLTWRDGAPVRLRDVASINMELVDRTGILSQNGGPSIAFNAQAETGVNVLRVMDDLQAAVQELNEGPVGRAGLEITQVYDESIYITQSIAMLRNNLLLGIALAIGILWVFLRKLRATMLVGLTIPVSLFVAFTALQLGGRSLNIISLAGLAFAMGMVLDAAIVVLENIVRLKEEGQQSDAAASEGATQVWPALLASTATTVAIFLPILFLRDVAGQLFADLAFAIAVAVITSLIIAVTIIPTAATTWLRNVELTDSHQSFWDRGTALIMRMTDTPVRRFGWIAGLVVVSIGLTLLLKPPADYLPEGKQNFVFGFILPPPGQSIDVAESEFTDVVNERFLPYLDGSAQPKIQSYFLGVFGRFGFMGARAEDRNDIDELLGVINGSIFRGFPDTMAFASRSSIFGRLGGGRGIELNIQSRDLDATLGAARVGMGAVMQALPEANVRPLPGVELAEPELRLLPDERKIAESGWTRSAVSSVIRALGDGLYVGDYFDGDKRRDIILRAEAWNNPEQLASLPVATPGGIMPVSELVSIKRTAGPDQIRRIDRRRTVTLDITPPENLSLEEAINTLKEQVEPAIRAQLPEDGDISYYGSADNLDIALYNMALSFALAVTILYLLVSALFRSFLDGLLIIVTLPLATVGGMVALRITDWVLKATGAGFQPMDLLTMIGFITLLGLVVNNAILLVHQTRRSEREGMARRQAVQTAVRIRLRPILMSTFTTLFGMLPLLLMPGAGTELYRGLAAVIVGGMAVSTAFTLILLPSMLRIGEAASEPLMSAQPGLAGG